MANEGQLKIPSSLFRGRYLPNRLLFAQGGDEVNGERDDDYADGDRGNQEGRSL